METYVAKHRGRYISMTVEGQNIEIYDSQFLEEGSEFKYPKGAFVMLVVAAPDTREN